MWNFFWSVIAVVLVLEGLLPSLMPRRWRRMMANMVQQPDKVLRRMGLVSMIVGAIILYWIHH